MKGKTANAEIAVYQTTGILLVFCGTAGNWTHTYPYQGGVYGSDPTVVVITAVTLGTAALAALIYRKLKKKKTK